MLAITGHVWAYTLSLSFELPVVTVPWCGSPVLCYHPV
jgi:hypothetical protein